MTGKMPIFDYGICMACGVCVQACPISCIALDKGDVDASKKVYPALLACPKCSGCGICQRDCPIDAIQMKELISYELLSF